jgi:hypothetical protein
MNTTRYVIYPPRKEATSYIVVGFAGGTPTSVFGCASRKAAKRLRRELLAREDARQEAAAPTSELLHNP